MHRIRKVEVAPDFKLRLDYIDEGMIVVDMERVIRCAGVFAPLADPSSFARVSIGEAGRFVEWPGGLDFCADALWMEAHGESGAIQRELISADN